MVCFARNDPTPRLFWEVACTMSRELQRRLLAFVTGVFRVPVGGLYQLTFRVTRLELHENAHQQLAPLPESQPPVLPLRPAGPPAATAAHVTHSKRRPEHKLLEPVRRVRIVKLRVNRHENLSLPRAHKGDRNQTETASMHESEQSFERSLSHVPGPGIGTDGGSNHVGLRLPRSNVCNGQLLLPSYRSRRSLQQALYFALLNTDYLSGAFD